MSNNPHKRSMSAPGRPQRPSGPGRPARKKVVRKKTTGKINRNAQKALAERLRKQAQRRKQQAQQRQTPPPPRRRIQQARIAQTAALTDEQHAQVDSLQDKFEKWEEKAQLSQIYTQIGEIEERLMNLPQAVEDIRKRGYVHDGNLEERLADLDEDWDELQPRVENALSAQVQGLEDELDAADNAITALGNPSASKLNNADRSVDRLETAVQGALTAVSSLYEGLNRQLDSIAYRITHISGILKKYEEAPDITLNEAEGPLLAKEAQWQQSDDEGPEGILFLTDQRLIFEQREEVVTKKRFGIFKAESEMVQEVKFAVGVHEIESISHKEEGGFLGMGKADILELIFAPSANLSRARFHIKGEDSSYWANMITKVQQGDMDEDRDEAYVEEMEEAEALTGQFPTTCATCFANIPPVPRGVNSVICEFCGATILPTVE